MSGCPGRGADAWEEGAWRTCLSSSRSLFASFSRASSKYNTLIIAEISDKEGARWVWCAGILMRSYLNSLITHLKLSDRRCCAPKFPVLTVEPSSRVQTDTIKKKKDFIFQCEIFLYNYKSTPPPQPPPPLHLPSLPLPLQPPTHPHTHTRSSPLTSPRSDDPMPNIFSLNGDGFLDACQIISIS